MRPGGGKQHGRYWMADSQVQRLEATQAASQAEQELRRQAEEKRLQDVYAFMANLQATTGIAVPPSLLAPVLRTPVPSPPPSAGSNPTPQGHHSTHPSEVGPSPQSGWPAGPPPQPGCPGGPSSQPGWPGW
ncbi:uncharacterized protein [Miscanthus floridulus]|uniref:uncharacterized protein n=1 Tax=Miscanthus floridulus TaxID=154761 RepID=UPI003459261D